MWNSRTAVLLRGASIADTPLPPEVVLRGCWPAPWNVAPVNSLAGAPGRRSATRSAGVALALHRVGDGHREQHGAGRRDPGDQLEGRGGRREDGEGREAEHARARGTPERCLVEQELGEEEQRRPAEGE